jgi:hypothetical protein
MVTVLLGAGVLLIQGTPSQRSHHPVIDLALTLFMISYNPSAYLLGTSESIPMAK